MYSPLCHSLWYAKVCVATNGAVHFSVCSFVWSCTLFAFKGRRRWEKSWPRVNIASKTEHRLQQKQKRMVALLRLQKNQLFFANLPLERNRFKNYCMFNQRWTMKKIMKSYWLIRGTIAFGGYNFQTQQALAFPVNLFLTMEFMTSSIMIIARQITAQ